MARPKKPSDIWPVVIRIDVPHAAKIVFEARRDFARSHGAVKEVPVGETGTRKLLQVYLEEHLKGVFVRPKR